MRDSDTLPGDPEDGEDVGEYDAMIEQLDGAISEITEKIQNGRIRDPEKDKVRVQYYRTLGYMMRTKRKILEDRTLEELAEEIEELREAKEDASGGSDFKL